MSGCEGGDAPAEEVTISWMRRLRALIIVVLVSAVLFVAGAESVLRALSERELGESERGLYVPGPVLGFRYASDYRGFHEIKGVFRVTVWTDHEGFRCEPNRTSPQYPDIILLGDSFIFGWGVEARETVSARLEQNLSGFSVRNCAVSGYDTERELLLYRQLLDRCTPQAAIVGYFGGNDIREILIKGHYRVQQNRLAKRYSALRAWEAYFNPDTGVLEFVHSSPERAAQSLLHQALDYSFTYQTLLKRMNRFPMLRKPYSLKEPFVYTLAKYPGLVEAAFQRSLEALLQMQRLSDEHGVQFLVVLVPFEAQIDPEAYKKWLASNGMNPDLFEPDYPQWRVRAFLEGHGVAYVDLIQPFAEAAGRGIKPFLEKDPHWSAEGHRIAAQAIADYFRARRTLREAVAKVTQRRE